MLVQWGSHEHFFDVSTEKTHSVTFHTQSLGGFQLGNGRKRLKILGIKFFMIYKYVERPIILSIHLICGSGEFHRINNIRQNLRFPLFILKSSRSPFFQPVSVNFQIVVFVVQSAVYIILLSICRRLTKFSLSNCLQ